MLSCLSSPVILTLIPAGRWVLATSGLSNTEAAQAQTYLTILMAGAGMDLFRHSLHSYFGGSGKTRFVLLSTFVMTISNIGVNYVLIL
ncbi:MAG: MATE family efflux transporter [SAR324 cluster bacterium]|nr:MATE family efflux transporter [SAR324 cluster bacterium]